MPDIAVASLKLLSCARGHFWETPVADDGTPRQKVCPECGAPQDEITLAPSEPLPPPQTPLPPPITDKTGKPNVAGYEILEDMGRGPAGISLYRARQLSVGRVVVLETVLARDDPSQQAWGALRGEAAALAKIPHPNIVSIFDSGERDRQLFYNATELVEGPTLASLIANKPMPVAQVLALGEVLARALHFAHEKGVIHRSLKPDRIKLLVQRSDKKAAEPNEPPACTVHNALCIPKIAGFGLAKARMVDGDVTDQELQDRFPSHLAPEQAWGRTRDIGPSTDVWALGTILYECLTGQQAFKASSPATTLEQIQSVDPLPIAKFRPGVPADVGAVIRRCLTKHPRRRYTSARELADDLRLAAQGRPTKARAANFLVRGVQWARRNPYAFVALAVALVGFIGILWASTSNSERIRSAEMQRDTARRELGTRQNEADALSKRVTDLDDRIARNDYYQQLSRAEDAIARNQLNLARQYLDYCRITDRGLEWHLLTQRISNAAGQPLRGRFNKRVSSVAWSPKGTFVALGTGDGLVNGEGEVRLFDLNFTNNEGQQLHSGNPGAVHQVGFSPDGQFLACATGNSATLYSIQNRQRSDYSPTSSRTSNFAFTSDGVSLLVSQTDGRVRRYDLRNNTITFDHPWFDWQPLNQTSLVPIVSLAPDGSRYVIPKNTNPQQLVVVESNGTRNQFALNQDMSGPMASHPETRWLAFASRDQKVRLFREPFRNDMTDATLQGHTAEITALAFTSDGKRLVTCSLDQTVRVWDVEMQREICKIPTGTRIPTAVAVSPGGNRIILGLSSNMAMGGSWAALWGADRE